MGCKIQAQTHIDGDYVQAVYSYVHKKYKMKRCEMKLFDTEHTFKTECAEFCSRGRFDHGFNRISCFNYHHLVRSNVKISKYFTDSPTA